MKVLLVLALALALVSAISTEESKDCWFVPTINGSFEWVTEEDRDQFVRQNSLIKGHAGGKVIYNLYTKRNPESAQILASGNASNLTNSNFNGANPTRFIIHGWTSSANSSVCHLMRDAFLAVGHYNVICVDWSDKAQTINYISSVLNVPGVGKQVAKMIDFLYTNGGLSFSDLLVAGHSLGAHVAGFAGKNVVNGRIQQITGLDPACPQYSYNKSEERLNKNDAIYVESIQTDGDFLGFLKPIGKGAFYPNGGRSQPGCILPVCSHSRSYQYYAEAIRKNDFPTVRCHKYKQATNKACGNTSSSVRMGAPTNYVNVSGYFYVPVNSESPFGLGA